MSVGYAYMILALGIIYLFSRSFYHEEYGNPECCVEYDTVAFVQLTAGGYCLLCFLVICLDFKYLRNNKKHLIIWCVLLGLAFYKWIVFYIFSLYHPIP
jgi:hypothetical protein